MNTRFRNITLGVRENKLNMINCISGWQFFPTKEKVMNGVVQDNKVY